MEHASENRDQKPFFPVSEFYKKKFGQKVFKIPVSIAGKCPNMKDGSGLKTCIFCDEWGSFAYPQNREENLRDQIEMHRAKVKERYNTQKFFVYFQAYTTSYTQLQRVRESFSVAQEFEDVVGIIIGTRPDCLSPALFDLFNETAEKTFMGVELGVQSFDNKQLEFMRRGHSAEQAIRGIERVKENCPQVNLGIHLMFGWPGETHEDIKESALLCNKLGLDNVKLHNLHVLHNTDLAKLYAEKKFEPVELEPYADQVAHFLSYLSPDIAVHRLVATASRWEELVAPDWTRHKMTNYQYVIDHLNKKGIQQGCRL